MQTESQPDVDTIQSAIDLLRRHIDWEPALQRQSDIEAQIARADFWDDQAVAQKIMREKNHLDQQIDAIRMLEDGLSEHSELMELAEEENDAEMIAEAVKACRSLPRLLARNSLNRFFPARLMVIIALLKFTRAPAAQRLRIGRLCCCGCIPDGLRRGFKLETIEESDGEEAGIKSATLRVSGVNAYGWMKTESGVHRLVRISPYDSSARRHTSFASVWIYPEVDENIDITIEEKDLRIDTYRSSGAGGQHVNTTDSAIRITHLPTNIVVQCQSDRSQHRNRATAMNMLKARLYELELQKREEAASDGNASKSEIGWGSQIRSYVLHPYQMVKDLRTNVETGNSQAVLDGDLDAFVEASLAARVGSTRT